jgi:hypothetical protein
MIYPEIPGWYEPEEIDEESQEYQEKRILPAVDIHITEDQLNNYRVVFETFYRRNYLIVSTIQFAVILILLLKILKSK